MEASNVIDGHRKTLVVAAALAIALIAGAVGWLAPSQALEGMNAVFGFIGRRISGAFSGTKLDTGLMVVTALGIEIATLGWRNSSMYRLLSARRWSGIVDSAIFAVQMTGMNNILSIVLTLGISVESGRLINWILSQYGWTRIELPTEGALSLAAAFGIFWLMNSFVQYWGHRLAHTPYFWHLHRFHHSATELNMITVFRQHPVEPVVLGFTSVVSPLLLFKVPDQILYIYLLVGTMADLLAHSHLPWSYGWVGSWVILSPRMHQIHHSADHEHRDLHFSNCPLWDHLFGTWYTGTKLPSAFGIPDNQYEHRPMRQFLVDALEFYATAARGILSLFRRRQHPPEPELESNDR